MRRSNKSNKVPNVKLRPAQPPLHKDRFKPPPSWTQDSDSSEPAPNASMQDPCPRPLAGVILCATGSMDKPTLFKQAFELGAISCSDFTDKVTHLLANDHGGAKYACALERKIPIMRPEWIHDTYQVWLRGDDVDIQSTINEYRLPVFSSVVLCLSGIEDVTRRLQINKLVTQQKGTYAKNLERPVKVTHLLCSGDEETEKMKYAEKFNQRGEADIHLVWEEWFWDSLEFGGRFDERKYQVNRPRPERKQFQEDFLTSCPVQNSAPGIRSDNPISVDHPQADYRSTPQNEDEDADEAALVKRIPAMTLKLWESLLKPRGYEISEGQLVRSPSKSQCQAGNKKHSTASQIAVATKIADENREGARVLTTKQSVLSSFKRTHSFAPTDNRTSLNRPFKRTATVHNITNGPEDAESSTEGMRINNNSSAHSQEVSSSHLFSGYKFGLLGEARSHSVRTAIEGCGGLLVGDQEADDVDFIIVRLVSGSKFYTDEVDERERLKFRTECWLEHSIFLETICPPDANVSFTPLQIDIPVPGAELVKLSVSGLDQSEICWIRRLLRALGINLTPNFSRRSTHLLCPSGTGAKFDKALEWGIPVVSLGWLTHIANSGMIPDANCHAVGVLFNNVSAREMERDPAVMDIGDGLDHVRKVDKGKRREFDVQIVDITNDSPTTDDSVPAVQLEMCQNRRANLEGPRHNLPPHCQESLFGQPSVVLAAADGECLPPSSPPPSSPPTSSSSLDIRTHQLPTSLCNNSPTVHGLHLQPSAEIESDAQDAHVPSSKSPSPMKLPASSGSGQTPNLPPIKVPNEITKALQESITSLLGKRHVTEEDVVVAQHPRGKRVRPQRPKTLQSRHDSFENSPPAPVPPYDFGPYEELNLLEGDSPADSVRVMYEDPGQRDEKNRLMRLFGSQPRSEEGESMPKKSAAVQKTRGITRRSSRIAGF